MWALVENNEISKVFKNPKSITIGDVNYPSNIFSVWSSDDLEGIGIYDVIIDNTIIKTLNITLTQINPLVLQMIRSRTHTELQLQDH